MRSDRTGPIAATLRWIALVGAAATVVWLLSDVLLLIFLSVLIAVLLRSAADLLSRWTRLPRRPALAVVTVLTTVALAALCYWIGPRLASEGEELWARLIRLIEALRQTYGQTPLGHAVFQRLSPSQLMPNGLAGSAASVAGTTLGSLGEFFVLVVTSLYLAIAPETYVSGFVRLFPMERRPRAREIMANIGHTLRWWLVGQLIDMIVVGVLTGAGLAALGVPLPMALGVLAGLLTFVPYFGSIAGAVPALLLGLTVSGRTAIWVAVLFLVAHLIEGYILSPLVQRRTVHLPPALSILSMTVLGALFGALGLVLGNPLAAAGLVAVREGYIRDVLGDQDD